MTIAVVNGVSFGGFIMKTLFATVLVSLLAIGSAASAQTTERKDLQVFNDIADQVNRYTQLTIFDSISASVDGGHVVLSGWVTMPYKRDDIEKRVAKVAGVLLIDNKIGVLPVSQFDDELRFRIARAIYSHSSFWNYLRWPTRRSASSSIAATLRSKASCRATSSGCWRDHWHRGSGSSISRTT